MPYTSGKALGEQRRKSSRDSRIINETFKDYGLDFLQPTEAQASKPSCTDIYLKACAKANLKPNSQLLQTFPRAPGSYPLTEINLASNFLGDKGVCCLVPVIEACQGLQRYAPCPPSCRGLAGLAPLAYPLRKSSSPPPPRPK